jgi:hypothetical protein
MAKRKRIVIRSTPLEKIFRYPDHELSKAASDLQSEFKKLKDRFERFVTNLGPTSNPQFWTDCVKVESDEQRVDVSFCGRTFRFVFDVIRDQGRTLGQVTCFTIPRNEPAAAIKQADMRTIGQFTFTTDGATNINPPPAGAPLKIDDESASIPIVLSFMLAGFEK